MDDPKLSHRRLGARGEVLLVSVAGEIDVYTFPVMRGYLREHVLEADELPEHVGLELSGVEYFDSCAVGVCVGFSQQFRQRRREGGVFIVGPSGRTKRIFRITGLRKVLPVVDSCEQLLELAGDPRGASERVWGAVWGPGGVSDEGGTM